MSVRLSWHSLSRISPFHPRVGMPKRLTGLLFAARHGKADGQADAAGPEAVGAQPHGGLVQQLVGHGPGLLRRCASPARAHAGG